MSWTLLKPREKSENIEINVITHESTEDEDNRFRQEYDMFRTCGFALFLLNQGVRRTLYGTFYSINSVSAEYMFYISAVIRPYI